MAYTNKIKNDGECTDVVAMPLFDNKSKQCSKKNYLMKMQWLVLFVNMNEIFGYSIVTLLNMNFFKSTEVLLLTLDLDVYYNASYGCC